MQEPTLVAMPRWLAQRPRPSTNGISSILIICNNKPKQSSGPKQLIKKPTS